MRLFRGISVPTETADRVVRDIRSGGLVSIQGGRQIEVSHPGPLDELFSMEGLSMIHTRSGKSYPVVCACGEIQGAAYYAFKHNRSGDNDTPVLIEFETDVQHVSLDGRDFLYTVFQIGNPDRASAILRRCFGPGVLRYARKAWATDDEDARIAFCDLAAFDPDVIASHHRNQTVIGGRYGTVFRNAFLAKLPVPPASIIRVWMPPAPIHRPGRQIDLKDCRSRR